MLKLLQKRTGLLMRFAQFHLNLKHLALLCKKCNNDELQLEYKSLKRSYRSIINNCKQNNIRIANSNNRSREI